MLFKKSAAFPVGFFAIGSGADFVCAQSDVKRGFARIFCPLINQRTVAEAVGGIAVSEINLGYNIIYVSAVNPCVGVGVKLVVISLVVSRGANAKGE